MVLGRKRTTALDCMSRLLEQRQAGRQQAASSWHSSTPVSVGLSISGRVPGSQLGFHSKVSENLVLFVWEIQQSLLKPVPRLSQRTILPACLPHISDRRQVGEEWVVGNKPRTGKGKIQTSLSGRRIIFSWKMAYYGATRF